MENVSNPYELLFLDSDEPNMKSIILTLKPWVEPKKEIIVNLL